MVIFPPVDSHVIVQTNLLNDHKKQAHIVRSPEVPLISGQGLQDFFKPQSSRKSLISEFFEICYHDMSSPDFGRTSLELLCPTDDLTAMRTRTPRTNGVLCFWRSSNGALCEQDVFGARVRTAAVQNVPVNL